MEESTLRWPTDKEREEMEEVCSIGEVPHTEKERLVSHARTVARECCKGDDASQWGNGKFDPLPRPNPLTIITKSCTRDYVMDIYRHAKFSHDPSRGFFFLYARNCASKMFTRLLFSAFFQRPTAQAPETIFTQNTSNNVVPCKDVALRVLKKINI